MFDNEDLTRFLLELLMAKYGKKKFDKKKKVH